MTKPRVHFVRWKDPLRVQEEDYSEDVVDQELKDLLEIHTKSRPFQPGGFVIGPHGILPAAPQNAPSELYNLWVMHTNFNLYGRIEEVLRQVPGVEILRIWSRYRAWVGIGSLFDSKDVHDSVRFHLGELFEEKPSREEVLARSATQPVWAVVNSPAGDVRLVQGKDFQAVAGQIREVEAVAIASWTAN